MLGNIVEVTIDRPLGSRHPEHADLVYPVNYGYVEGIMGGDGEWQDAYVLGVDQAVERFTGHVICIIRRLNDSETKWVVVPENMMLWEHEIEEQVSFQERFFTNRMYSMLQKSCGAILYRMMNGRRQYLLLQSIGNKFWSFAKGHMMPGETDLQNAQREVYEETGLTFSPIPGFIHEKEYHPYGRQEQLKRVVLFLGEIAPDKPVRLQASEIIGHAWLPYRQALERLSYEDDRESLRRSEIFLKSEADEYPPQDAVV